MEDMRNDRLDCLMCGKLYVDPSHDLKKCEAEKIKVVLGQKRKHSKK